jgi:hypothetical protein
MGSILIIIIKLEFLTFKYLKLKNTTNNNKIIEIFVNLDHSNPKKPN